MTLDQLLAKTGEVIRLAGAHNPLSARLVEKAGFSGVWASGFEIATSLGVPDADVLTWREMLAVANSMKQAVNIPIVADCGTGFGGLDIVREMATCYSEAGISAICLEDGASPRRNSLLEGSHGLADCSEFAAKIEVARSCSDTMLVIARVQSLVAQQGKRDALARARAYVLAGADAIVFHSRNTEPEEVLSVVAEWDVPTPLILIPTTYNKLTIDQATFNEKVRVVIYANHGLRAAIAAMKRAFSGIISDRTSHFVEEWIASLDETFALQQKE